MHVLVLNALPLLAGQGQTSYPATEFPSRALASSFSPTYTQSYEVDEYGNNLASNSLVGINNVFEFEQMPFTISGFSAVPGIPYPNYDLVRHYLLNVVEIQASI
jgi:hypothetical protein